MKIATWNVERLKHVKDKDRLLSVIRDVSADILVLTETDERLKPAYPYCWQTPLLKDVRPDLYKDTEHRISIFTKYKCIAEHPTFDKYTSLCAELETEYGSLLIYGTIMGIFGNRDKSFMPDLEEQMQDIRRFCEAGHNICVIGDYNLSFSDNYYYTKRGRECVLQNFENSHIFMMTGHRAECIDHIALSDDYMYNGNLIVTSVNEWNEDKNLSDHKGIVIEIQQERLKSVNLNQDIFFNGTGLERHEFEYGVYGKYVCYKASDGAFYKVDHFDRFYVMEFAENEDEARICRFEDTDTVPDYIPLGELVFWVHHWLEKYA